MSVKPLNSDQSRAGRLIVESSRETVGSTVQQFNGPTVAIYNRQHAQKVNRRLLKTITNTLLTELLQIQNAELGICLVAAPEMTRLNETFLKHRGPTDVIAFDYGLVVLPSGGQVSEKQNRLKPGHQTLHGDIFICADEAVVQARRFGADWRFEIVRYVVHGILHLLGHDDRRAAARRKMNREEDRLVCELSRRFALSEL